MSSSSRELYREGFLQKAGRRSFQAWRKRWFVLNGTIVKYYPTQDTAEANLLGTIDMSEVQSIANSRTVKNGFELATKSRTYCVSGKSEEERSEWISILKRASHIGQEVQRQRSINSDDLSRESSIDAGGDGKATMLPSSLYDTLRDAENAKKGRSSSKMSLPSAEVPIKATGTSDDDAVYDVPKSPFRLTDGEEVAGDDHHYKSPRGMSADDRSFARGVSSSDDELDADESDSHKRRFARRNHSMDSIATVDSEDFTEVESEDEYASVDDVDGDSASLIASDEDFLPTPKSDKGVYAVDELKLLAKGTPNMSPDQMNMVLAERNCSYSDPDYPAFEALKMLLKIN